VWQSASSSFDVILNGGEAAVRDPRPADGSMKLIEVSAAWIASQTAVVVHIFVRSLGGLFALLRMTSLRMDVRVEFSVL